ncbi:MAG: hypothetical protein AABW54_00830, partial [Candidatus Micrarchaeota archaeon]
MNTGGYISVETTNRAMQYSRTKVAGTQDENQFAEPSVRLYVENNPAIFEDADAKKVCTSINAAGKQTDVYLPAREFGSGKFDRFMQKYGRNAKFICFEPSAAYAKISLYPAAMEFEPHHIAEIIAHESAHSLRGTYPPTGLNPEQAGRDTENFAYTAGAMFRRDATRQGKVGKRAWNGCGYSDAKNLALVRMGVYKVGKKRG